MRLQLSISRHTLPPAHILFSTASHPSAHTSSRNATIADLLHDINELVPLESEDGEWGLEDYVVEVAATADQDNVYEALHFQGIDSVLREDDEVEIRYLKSGELKGRRYGGRLQITGDGRHLVDGVVWGRRWLGAARAGARPGVEIPPRKRRRILATEEEDEMQAEEPLLALLGQAEQDDMDDDDYAEEEDANQVKVITAFDDADQAHSENEDDEMEEMEEDEVQLLLKEAAEVEDALDASEAVLESQLRSRTRLGKRKRIFEDENGGADFEGFSTPVKSPASRQVQFEGVESDSDSDSDGDRMLAVMSTKQAQKVHKNQLPAEEEEQDSPNSHFESSHKSSSAETEDDSASDVDDASPRLRRPRRHEVKTSETSSSGTSSSESEDSDSSDSSSETSSSGTSESESETSETSSSSDSDSEVKRSTKAAAVKTTLSPQISRLVAALQQPPNRQAGSAAPPGQGKASTRRKNQRVKMVRQLKRLKEEGRLPADADLDALRAYEASAGQSQPQSTADETPLEAARIKALARVQALEPAQAEEGEVDNDSPEPSRETESYQPTAESEVPEASATVEPTQEAPQSAPSSSVKRSRLDVAASRRLLFGSLGLRAPKTPAEEQILRAKLDKSAKQRPDRRAERSNSPPPEETSQHVSDSWQEKLIISAIECTKEGLKLDPPPFPFQQYSTKRKLNFVDHEPELDYGEPEPPKPEQQPDMRFQDVPDPAERLKLKKLHASLPNFTVRECYEALQACKWDHDDARELLFEAEASQPLGGQPTASATQDSHRAGEVSDNGSRTVSFAKDEADGMPIPTDFAALIDLGTDHLLPGAVIAYKELWVNPATSQPDVSPYRVARILECDGEDFITVVLAIKDRDKPRPRDPDTGEVIMSGFEIRSSEDDEPDEGIRELRFADMMTPKLVETPVQVPGSSAVTNLRGGHMADDDHHQSSGVVPDSVPSAQNKDSISLPKVEVQQVEIDTPRRTEITTMIKEAGFNSAMDEDLLEPLSARVTRSPVSPQSEVIRENKASIVVEIPSQPAIAETSQVQTNGWNSSPLFPPQASMPASADEGITTSDDVQPTSSPPVSPQLTVEYPHISQMDLDSSYRGPEESSKNSSSHQDAQRVSAITPADVTLTVTEDDEQGPSFDDDGDVSFEDEPMNELQSEVPQSQSQEPSNLQPLAEPDDDDVSTPRTRSFLGRRGVGGPTSSPSFHSSDDDLDVPEEDGSGSESSLPSLTELTSSQRRKIKPATTRSSLNEHLSPPPVSKKSLKHKDLKDKISKSRKSSTPPTKLQNSFDGADDDDADLDLPPSSQVEPASSIDPLQRDIKLAPSQKEKRLSQIPLGTQVVDLTMSSDPVSPSDSDSEYGVKNRRGTLKGRKPNGKAKGKKSMLGTSLSDLGAGTGVGIGTRRFLTSKKSRSQI